MALTLAAVGLAIKVVVRKEGGKAMAFISMALSALPLFGFLAAAYQALLKQL